MRPFFERNRDNFNSMYTHDILGRVECNDDADWLKRCINMEIEGTQQSGRSWKDCDYVKGGIDYLTCPVNRNQ